MDGRGQERRARETSCEKTIHLGDVFFHFGSNLQLTTVVSAAFKMFHAGNLELCVRIRALVENWTSLRRWRWNKVDYHHWVSWERRLRHIKEECVVDMMAKQKTQTRQQDRPLSSTIIKITSAKFLLHPVEMESYSHVGTPSSSSRFTFQKITLYFMVISCHLQKNFQTQFTVYHPRPWTVFPTVDIARSRKTCSRLGGGKLSQVTFSSRALGDEEWEIKLRNEEKSLENHDSDSLSTYNISSLSINNL